jgi:glycosyltransferase involved in cell wall biosynthesis
LVIGGLQGGGAERQISDMANYWAAAGLEVTLATWSGPAVRDFYALDNRVRRVHLGRDSHGRSLILRMGATLQRMFRLRKLLATTAPRAVLSLVTESNVLTILAAARLRVRIVVSERTQPAQHVTLSSAWKFLRRELYSRADVVVAQTHDAAQWIKQNCRKDASVIPNALRSLPPISDDRQPLIIAVGRLSREKGFDLLLRAFAKVAPQCRDWSVVIVGEGPERVNLLRLCAELMLTDRVRFVGEVSEVEAWMACAGLVVQPSRFEGFPNVVLESMGMGAPVISSDCSSGPSDLIEDGVNGRLVPVDDVDALAQVMAELMSQPEVRRRLGREGSKVRLRFSQDLIMAQWEAHLLPGLQLARRDGARRMSERQ